MNDVSQKKLSAGQLEAFYHSQFVGDQIAHFCRLLDPSEIPDESVARRVVVDIGGGVGYFAEQLRARTRLRVRVLEQDPASVAKCRERGIDAELVDAVRLSPRGDEMIVCFNLILHHLVGGGARATRELQVEALSRWRPAGTRIFVNEYIYESYVTGFSSSLIHWITSSTALSAIAKVVSLVVPSLRANTFGVGVRFREESDWNSVFRDAGFRVAGRVAGQNEHISIARRMLLIKSIRRSSFALSPMEAR